MCSEKSTARGSRVGQGDLALGPEQSAVNLLPSLLHLFLAYLFLWTLQIRLNTFCLLSDFSHVSNFKKKNCTTSDTK